jgi:hypothetical protein
MKETQMIERINVGQRPIKSEYSNETSPKRRVLQQDPRSVR